MVKQIKDNRRKNAARKIRPDPAWAEAFMILLLAKAGGKVSISLDRLKTFTRVQDGSATQLEYDEENKAVTLKLHEKLKIKKSNILTLEKRVII